MKISLAIILALVLGIGTWFFWPSELPRSGGEFNFYAGTVTATTTTTAAGKAAIVLAANSARGYAVITNTSATIAYLALNATSTPNSYSLLEEKNYAIPLAASGGTYIINRDNLYLGQVIATSSAAVTIRALQAY